MRRPSALEMLKLRLYRAPGPAHHAGGAGARQQPHRLGRRPRAADTSELGCHPTGSIARAIHSYPQSADLTVDSLRRLPIGHSTLRNTLWSKVAQGRAPPRPRAGNLAGISDSPSCISRRVFASAAVPGRFIVPSFPQNPTARAGQLECAPRCPPHDLRNHQDVLELPDRKIWSVLTVTGLL